MTYERRVKAVSTGLINIPIGGGRSTTSLTLADFGLNSKIEAILNISIKREVPIADDVFASSEGINDTFDGIGITLAAGSGTTLSAEATVLGY